MTISPNAVDQLSALVLGFAFAGVLASAFELVARRPLGFGLLQAGGLGAAATVPVLVFSAPLIIIRNTVRGRRYERRPVPYVMLATMFACGWSLLSGRLVLDAAQLLAGA